MSSRPTSVKLASRSRRSNGRSLCCKQVRKFVDDSDNVDGHRPKAVSLWDPDELSPTVIPPVVSVGVSRSELGTPSRDPLPSLPTTLCALPVRKLDPGLLPDSKGLLLFGVVSLRGHPRVSLSPGPRRTRSFVKTPRPRGLGLYCHPRPHIEHESLLLSTDSGPTLPKTLG